jgi:hypothetical protein
VSRIRSLRISLLLFLGFVLFLFPPLLPAADQDQPRVLEEQKGPDLDTLLGSLTDLEEPVSREGAGYLIAQAPGERYKLPFRLIARGPEAFRLELYDIFGRPSLLMISYLGETRLFSLSQQKEIPLERNSSGPLAALAEMPVTDMAKIFWGRIPLSPYDQDEIKTVKENSQESLHIILKGMVRQEFWVIPRPFALLKGRITPLSKTEQIEITFSEFSSAAGTRQPLECEVRQEAEDRTLIIHYDTVVARTDIPDTVFDWPRF